MKLRTTWPKVALAGTVFTTGFVLVAMALSPPDFSKGQAKIVQVPVPTIGDKVNLPTKDAFGKMMPEGAFVLISLPMCNSCSARKIPASILSDKYKVPIVLATQDVPSKTIKEMGITESSRFWVFQDSNGSSAGPGMAFYAPRGILVDKANKVVAVDMEAESLSDFLQKVAK